MKKKTPILKLICATLAVQMMACAGTPGQGFEISVSAPDCNNLMLRLCRDNGDRMAVVDSQKVEMHKARLHGCADTPELMYIYLESADDYLPIFVENGQMSVDINRAKPGKSAISGSESNKIFTDFMQAYSVYDGKAAGYNKTAMNASRNNDTLLLQDLESEQDAIRSERVAFQRSFVQKYTDHPIACYIISSHLMYDLSPLELEALMDSIPPANRANKYYKSAERRLAQLKSPMYADSCEYERISRLMRISCNVSAEKTTSAEKMIIQAATLLQGKPYVAGTLDNGADERLISDMYQLDCVTFQETCLALARDAMDPEPGFQNFRRHLENIRYRNGRNTGYASRLHYSTDWILDNTRRGNASDITPSLGGVRMTGAINFMSTHADKYKALVEEPSLVDSMKIREKYLTANHVTYIPKAQIDRHAGEIESGSLIFIATAIPGLGYSHVGIAYNDQGCLRMMHASSVEKKVSTTQGSLQEYLMGQSKALGITVLKP